MEPTKIAVLGSTKGTDLPAIVESIKNGELKGLADITLVISNNQNAGILSKAKDYGIENYFINPKDEKGNMIPKFEYNVILDELLENKKIELLVNIGWMRLYSGWFVDKYYDKNMNIHPSLLPSFPGMDLDVHQAVLDYGCKVTGCTLFFIDKGKDSGPIILQKAVPVLENDTEYTLKERVQKAEQEVLVKGIKLFAENKLYIDGRKVHILDGV